MSETPEQQSGPEADKPAVDNTVVEAASENVEPSSEEAVEAAEASESVEVKEEAPAKPPVDDNKKWFIVNCQTSCENVAKLAIMDRIRTQRMEESFGEILIPL